MYIQLFLNLLSANALDGAMASKRIMALSTGSLLLPLGAPLSHIPDRCSVGFPGSVYLFSSYYRAIEPDKRYIEPQSHRGKAR